MQHSLLEFLLLPALAALLVVAVFIRFFYSAEDSFFQSRYRLLLPLFSTFRLFLPIPAQILLPLVSPVFPLLFYFVRQWFVQILKEVRRHNALFLCEAESSSFSLRQFFSHFASSCLEGEGDLTAYVGGLTGVSFVDKKGLLSSANPIVEKLFFFRRRTPSDSLFCLLLLQLQACSASLPSWPRSWT